MSATSTISNTLDYLFSIPSPSGAEQPMAEWFVEELKSVGQVSVDSMFNAYCRINPGASKTLMISAHSDEIGLQVIYISEDGFLYCRRIGAIDTSALIGSEVNVLSNNTVIPGVIGKRPIHLMDTNIEKLPQLDEIWVDIGCTSREEAELMVEIGDWVVQRSNYKMINRRIMSKSLDDKLGCYVVVEVMKQLVGLDKDLGIVGCIVSQEEVGCRGSIVASERVKPEYAVCVDLGFATDYPGMPETLLGKMHLGDGVVINHNCDNDYNMIKLLINVANENQIPYQSCTFPVATGGSDVARIQLSGNGVKTALLSIPCRYMHTPVEICDMRDVEAAIRLIVSFIDHLNKYGLKTETFVGG